MKFRALVPTAAAAAIAFAQPVAFLAQEAGKAAEILGAARKAIGGGKLDAMKTFTVQSSLQRNTGSMQIASDLEIVLDLPDKYLRTETPSGNGGMMMIAGGGVSGFNGDRTLQKLSGAGMSPGGGMVIRMGGAATFGGDTGEKATPEQLEQMNRTMVRNIGLGNFEILLDSDTFWMVIWQSCIFAVSAVLLKALIGFILAHQLHHIPAKGQKKWRGMLLIPWVIPPALSTLGWWWMFDPSYSSINWVLGVFGVPAVPWLGEAGWARFAVILVNVWYGAPFFMIMYLAALKSVPDQLYEAAAIDGANWWQRIWYVTLPMMRNIIAITTLFSLIVTFANFDIVRILTSGGPLDQTHLFATWAFQVGIQSSDIPLGACVSLFMVPILAVAAIFILRDVNKRGNEA